MNDLLLRALRTEETERRPVWVMRQAGRYLPEYRALREKFSFEELCARPDLAAEVTLMPIERFRLDGAVIFADIMSPVAALDVEVRFAPGPVIDEPLRTAAAIDALPEPDPEAIAPEVLETIAMVKRDIHGRAAVLGFCGGPWTLAAYLVQGRGVRDFPALRALAAADEGLVDALLARLTRLSIAYLRRQVEAGADAVQVFETWSGILAAPHWARLVRPHLSELFAGLADLDVPRILFLQNGAHLVAGMVEVRADGYSLDWRVDLAEVRRDLGPEPALQGNIDPAVLLSGPEATARAARTLLQRVPARGHVVNLGHGILPETPMDSVRALIDAVHAEAASPSANGGAQGGGQRPDRRGGDRRAGDAADEESAGVGIRADGSQRDDAGGRPRCTEVTAELLQRYDRQGPRYTSYPTAVEFGDGVDARDYAKLLAAADTHADEPLSLYVHLPFCEERCLFCACHVIITPHVAKTLPYLDSVRREIDLVAAHLPHRRQVSQLHLGGGTPTYHGPEHLAPLLDHLLDRFERRDDAELAVEVDPRVTRRDHLDMLAARGFNRVSMGVQDFTPAVQEAVHRVQSIEQTRRLIEHARSLGFTGINIDLIYGLPHQSLDSFVRTVDTVIDLGVDRLAVYSFALVPWMRAHQTRIDEAALPGRELKLHLFAAARERLLDAGYEPIGMDHFAKPDDELARARRARRLRRNFQGYSVIPASDVIGLGISAIGDVQGSYVQNVKKLTAYQQALEAGELPVLRGVRRDADDALRREVIHDLMCNFHVDVAAVERSHDIDFSEYFAEDLAELSEHQREGMVVVTDDAIEVTPVGELFVRNIAMCFDRFLRRRRGDQPVFSRTV